jgi:nucleotide-binding universal stress UspA family protein
MGIAVETSTPEGPPEHAILEAARGWPADLIVMTTHGRTGLGRLVFGSVAEAVLRSAPCPVLLIRVAEAED